MPAELPASFSCRATAAVLRSGSVAALTGHAAALMSAIVMAHRGLAAWIAGCSILVWCAVVYFAIRVKIDAQLFELLAVAPPEQLDDWLVATNLRKRTRPRTIQERQRGAIKLWRALMAAITIEIAVLFVALLCLLA